MKCSSHHSHGVWDTLLMVAVVALAGALAPAPRALADDSAEEGRVVEINPGASTADLDARNVEVAEHPEFWLGIHGQAVDSPALRTHLQLAEGVGLVVEGVAEKSPAEKVGLKQHDILIAVNGEQIDGMATLQKAVADSKGKPLTLKVIRLTKEIEMPITPEAWPKGGVKLSGSAGFNMQVDPGDIGGLLRQFAGPGAMRVIGPGMIFGGQQMNMNGLPGGVAVTVTRDGDGPATVTVKKGDETWTVKGDDEKALRQLPDDVRPFVEQMVQQPPNDGAPFNFNRGRLGQQLQRIAPDQIEGLGFGDLDDDEASQRILRRMEQMEKRLERLQRRLNDESSDNAKTAPGDAKT